MTVRELVNEISTCLSNAGIENPRGDATEIVKKVFGLSDTEFILSQNNTCSETKADSVFALTNRRVAGEPIQYIIGEWSFCSHDFKVGKGVLIPRPETEYIVYKASEFINKRKGLTVLDLCTGSGCIGISIAVNNPECEVYLADISVDALGYAEKNMLLNGAKNIKIINYNIFDGFNSRVFPSPDIIVSNPPYIPRNEIEHLQAEVKFEPKEALDGGNDGLDFYRCLADKWLPYIKPGGAFIFESGEEQPKKIASMISGFASVVCESDIFSVERFIVGYK